MQKSSIAILVISFLCVDSRKMIAQPIPRQISDIGEISGYHDKVSKIVGETIVGYRVKSTLKMWDPVKYDKKVSLDYLREAVFGQSIWIEKSTAPAVGGGVIVDYSWANGDEEYAIVAEKSGKFSVGKHTIEWEKSADFAMSFNTYAAVSAMVYAPYATGQTFVRQGASEYEGRPALKLEYTLMHDLSLAVYLDRDTYQFLYSEQPRSYDMATRSVKDQRLITRTTYRDAGGKRLPERFERYKLTAGGEKLPQEVIEFTEYVPYTATADELDLEKRFGIKPIPLPPRPESARRGGGGSRSAWWYAAGAGLVGLAVALVLVARRRRRAAG